MDLAQAVAGGVVPDLEGLRPVRSPAAGVIDAALPPGAQGLKILHIQRKGIRHDAQLAPGPAGGRNRQQGEGVPHRDPGDAQGQAAAQTAGHGALPLRQGHAGGFAGDGVLRRQVKPHPSHRQGPGTAQGQADGGGPSLFRRGRAGQLRPELPAAQQHRQPGQHRKHQRRQSRRQHRPRGGGDIPRRQQQKAQNPQRLGHRVRSVMAGAGVSSSTWARMASGV